MARRELQSFNLSFLDLLSGALGAVIFLFIIVPKGKNTFPEMQRKVDATAKLDTQTMRFVGRVAFSTRHRIGDTILVALDSSYVEPLATFDEDDEDAPWYPYYPPPEPPQPRDTGTGPSRPNRPPAGKESDTLVGKGSDVAPGSGKAYKGPKPSAPCRLAFEINWADEKENADILVYKGSTFVSGTKNNRVKPEIGQWDTGVSKTKIFTKTDFRTNMEAVRQINALLPGEYKIYAVFKESANNANTLSVNLLLYSKTKEGVEKGQEHNFRLFIRPKPSKLADFTLLGTATVREDGTINFSKN
jgi:hypothetical protein